MSLRRVQFELSDEFTAELEDAYDKLTEYLRVVTWCMDCATPAPPLTDRDVLLTATDALAWIIHNAEDAE